MKRRWWQAFLFLFGASVAGFIGADLPTTKIGYAEQGLLLWFTMYPFAASTGFPMRVYWQLLGVIPVSVALRFYAAPAEPFLKVAVAILFGVSLIVLTTRQIRRMRGHRQ